MLQVNAELSSRFYDTASATGPFSTSAIYGHLHASKMIVAHESVGKADKKGRMKHPGPDKLLQLNDGVKNREKKEEKQRILKEICDKFEAADID